MKEMRPSLKNYQAAVIESTKEFLSLRKRFLGSRGPRF